MCWLHLSERSWGFLLLHTHTGGFKAEAKHCTVTQAWLVSQLMQAGSFQRPAAITKAPFKPSIYFCCFQEHTQFTIWPGALYALSLTQINTAPLIAGMLMMLTPRHGPAEQPSASSARSSRTVLQPARCHRPCSPGPWLVVQDKLALR